MLKIKSETEKSANNNTFAYQISRPHVVYTYRQDIHRLSTYRLRLITSIRRKQASKQTKTKSMQRVNKLNKYYVYVLYN